MLSEYDTKNLINGYIEIKAKHCFNKLYHNKYNNIGTTMLSAGNEVIYLLIFELWRNLHVHTVDVSRKAYNHTVIGKHSSMADVAE